MNNRPPMSAMSAEDRFGTLVVSRLSDVNDDLSHEISERLKAARMMALSKRKVLQVETATSVVSLGQTAALHLGGEKFNWWSRLAAVVPLIALAVGLLTIQSVQDDFWASEIATVDAELLTDELPPAAYADPGFAQYLRTNARD